MKIPFKPDNHLKEKILAAFILIALLVIYYNAVVFQGKSFMSTIERTYRIGHYHYSGTYWHVVHKFPTVDPTAANQINLPSAYLENHYLRTFQLPLWNPYSGLGRPYNADMNSYTFFLPIYLFKLFPTLIMYDLFLLLRLFLSGFFLFLCLRLYKCTFWIAIAGSSFFMFNSYFHVFIDMDHLNVTLFLSPMVYFLTKFIFSFKKRYLIGFMICSAGSFYGGNPNEYVLIHVFVSLYFGVLVFIRRDSRFKKKFGFLLSYGTALCMSVLLSSLKLIPFVEFWKHSISSRIGGVVGTSVFLPFKRFLLRILSPDQRFEGPNYIGYLMLSILFFALFNLIRKKWQLREKILAFHFVLLFLFISKISNAAYIKWVGTLPLFNSINYIKYCSLIYYTISVIAAFSLTYLVEDIRKKRNRMTSFSLLVFCWALPHFILWGLSKNSLFHLADHGNILSYMLGLYLLTGFFLILFRGKREKKMITDCLLVVMMILVVFELRLNNRQYYQKRFKINDKAPYTQFLLQQKQPYRALGIGGTFSPNCNLIYPIPTINRMFALRVKRSTILLSELISEKFNSGMGQVYHKADVWNNPYLDLLNTKYYISESIFDSIVIDRGYAKFHKMKSLLNNPSMQYTRCGNLYYYSHRGWRQMSDSSIDIPIRLPYGDVSLKSTALAFNFDWRKRENPDNRLYLMIFARQDEKKELVHKRTFIPHRKEDQDFFSMRADLSRYAGQDIVLNFTLLNPGARNRNDRTFFFGDLRITHNQIKRSSSLSFRSRTSLETNCFETLPYEEVFSRHGIVYQNNRALERGFVLYGIRQVKDVNESTKIMKEDPFIYKDTALIEGPLPQKMKITQIGHARVSFLEYKANYIKIGVETTENGIFILSDAYYPGWKAYLNKKRVKIYPAFGALRAVFLPQGKHELEFSYRPWTFFVGAVLTVLSVFFMGYLFIRFKDPQY